MGRARLEDPDLADRLGAERERLTNSAVVERRRSPVRSRSAHSCTSATQGRWTGLTLAQAVFRSADHYVLTEVCGVHKLIECGIDHVAANRLAEPQRRIVLSLWGF